jgi:hypothetical protein
MKAGQLQYVVLVGMYAGYDHLAELTPHAEGSTGSGRIRFNRRPLAAGAHLKEMPFALVVDGEVHRSGLQHRLTDTSEIYFPPSLSGGAPNG